MKTRKSSLKLSIMAALYLWMLSLLRCVDLFKFCIVSAHTFAHYTHMHMNRHSEMSHGTSWLDWMRWAKLAQRPFFSWYRHPTLGIEDEMLVAVLLTHPELCNRYQHGALKVPVSAHLRVYVSRLQPQLLTCQCNLTVENATTEWRR